MKTESVDLRYLALETLLDAEKTGNKTDDVLHRVLEKYSYLSKAERSFYHRVVTGTVELRIRLDYIINAYSRLPVSEMKPVIGNILRMSAYQLFEMDSVPESAVVNEAVKLAKKKGFSSLCGFVNAVLRNMIRNPGKVIWPHREDTIRYLSVAYSMPEMLVKLFIGRYGFETAEKICASFLEREKLTVRIRGNIKETEQTLLSLAAEGVDAEQAPYPKYAYYLSKYDSVAGLSAFKQGKLIVQDVSSMLAVEAASIRPKEIVLDVCAAPGGKSLFAADRTGPSGKVTARDISEKKVELIKENIIRCGLKNIKAEVFDAARPDPSLFESMDVVLVDAPCSGYGVIGRRPDIKYGASADKIKALASLQRIILKNAALCVKPGGRLIYSTCTISKAENEDNVDAFLASEPFKPYDLSAAFRGGFEKKTAKDGYVQLLPGIDCCDGFFVAGFIKENK